MLRRSLCSLAAAALLAGCGLPGAVPSGAPSTAEAPATVALQAHDLPAGTIYAPAGLAAEEQQGWSKRIERAVAVLTATDLGPSDDDWTGRLVVELPGTAADYQTLAGPAGPLAAAVTRCRDGASRITVNPAIRQADPDYLDALVLHEAVHVATAAACRETPLWIEEGLAEWLTVHHHPAAERANREWLTRELAGGLPSGLPRDEDFQGPASQVSGAYALAVLAVEVAIGRLGQERAMAYFAAPDEATTGQIAAAYLDELRVRLSPPTATASAPR